MTSQGQKQGPGQGQGRRQLEGQVALVTGAGAGIGRACAIALARAGASVAVTDIDGGAARAVAAEIGAEGRHAWPATPDVSSADQVSDVIAETIARLGRIDVLVNNAGIGARVAAVDLPLERWQRIIDIGLSGTFLAPAR